MPSDRDHRDIAAREGPAGFEPALSPPEGEAIVLLGDALTRSGCLSVRWDGWDFGTYWARRPMIFNQRGAERLPVASGA